MEDAAQVIVLATEGYDKSEHVNIGAGFEISIRELVELIVMFTGFDGEIVWDATKPDGQPRRMLDVSRGEREFGFRAQESLRGVEEFWHGIMSVKNILIRTRMLFCKRKHIYCANIFHCMESDTIQIPRKMIEEIYVVHEKIDHILETLEVLMDTETLKRLHKGEDELKKGNYIDAQPDEIEALLK